MHGGAVSAWKGWVDVQRVSDVAASAPFLKFLPYSVALVGQTTGNGG